MQNSVKCQFFLILLLSLVFNPATASAPADSTDAALDSLLLSIEGMELDEIVVTARRPIVESDGATLTYNVAEDPSAASRNVLDMMLRSAWKNQHSNFGISLTWKFGSLKSDLKSTGASVDNNDSAAGTGESRGR